MDAGRLIGTAHYENDKFAEAAAEFRKCIELAPRSATDRFNLGLTLMRARKYAGALVELTEAQKLDPDLLAPHYVRGIIHKRQNSFPEAIEALKHVVQRDPKCAGAYYNLGVCHKYLQQYEQAIEAFKKEAQLSPTDPSTQVQLITLYRRTGQIDQANRHKEIYDRVKDTVDESQKTPEALERSKYTYVIKAPRLTADLTPNLTSTVRFVEVTEQSGLPKPGTLHPARRQAYSSGIPHFGYVPLEQTVNFLVPLSGNAVTLADYDGDGDLDIYFVNCSDVAAQTGNRLYRNNGEGQFTDVTAEANVGDSGMGMDAVFGDYDNDGDLDLYVANYGPNVLYRNRGDGTFEDVSPAARVNEPQYAQKVLFFDYDHDNDLDIFIANGIDLASGPAAADSNGVGKKYEGQSNTLLRNNGDGTFSDQTDEAGLLVAFAQAADAIVADFDGDYDTDLLVANRYGLSRLFANARMGRFVVADSYDGGVVALAQGDFNHDSHSDVIFAKRRGGMQLNINDGHARFTQPPIATRPKGLVQRIALLDYNNDGWSDLLLHDDERAYLLAGAGKAPFQDVSSKVGLGDALDDSLAFAADFAVGDLDGDGDQDIVVHTFDRGPLLFRNDGGNKGNWLNVRLVGKKVNRSGYGATVEIASGGHYQKQTYRDGPVHFGFGSLKHVDVVRVTWPNGVAQNVIRPAINQSLTIEEFVKVSASCAFLYADNGSGFKMINEILGVGPLGVPMAPGVYFPLDCTELTRIEAHEFAADNGFYELRLTEELRETMYADQMTLRAVDHPAGLEIIPNEMFTLGPFPKDKFFAVADHRPPVSAIDDRGADVLPLILEHDDCFPTFLLTHYDGLAEPHSLTLDLGDLSGAETITLFLDGWIYWANSSVSMAIAQDPGFTFEPLTLEVRDASGNWRIAIEWVGLPTSKGIVVPVDLTGRFLCDDYHVRLSTNMCVYFDRIFVATDDLADRCRQTEMPVASADLHYRGFSRMTRDELGFERFDYADVSPTGSWNPPKGMLTRYGDVTPLLAEPDDQFVIFGPGDELTMRFDGRNLPELPAGWTRDFIFYANGWVKDGDLNTKHSDTVTPLPFHGMSGYPYPDTEHYPDTPEHRQYQRTYNTRPAGCTVGKLTRTR